MIETTAPATTSATTQPKREPLPSDLRTQVGLAFGAFILIGAIDAAVGVLLPSLRAFYSIDKATVGIMFAASTCGYLVSAFTSGLLVEKLGTRLFMMAGPAILVLAAIVISFTPPFVVLMIGFLLSGFGTGIIDAGLNAYVAGLPGNTVLLNFLHAFYGVGALLGPLLATGLLAYAFQWNSLYYLWMVAEVILVIGFALAFKGRAPNIEHHEQHREDKEGNAFTLALKQRVVWVAAFFLLMYVGLEVSLAGWSFSFLTEERHQAETLSGLSVSAFWLGLTLGRIVLGKVGERVGNRRLIELCLGGVVVGVLVVWLVPVGLVMLVGLALVGFSLGPIFPTTIAMMSELVPARILPNAIGFMTSFGSMGAALMPALVGAISEETGLWVLMPYEIVLTAILLGLWAGIQASSRQALREI